eukprot:3747012-Ditylum_brightwellii.AAC.1
MRCVRDLRTHLRKWPTFDIWPTNEEDFLGSSIQGEREIVAIVNRNKQDSVLLSRTGSFLRAELSHVQLCISDANITYLSPVQVWAEP